MKPIEEILTTHVSPEPNSGCWIWTGYITNYGYGSYGMHRGRGGKILAHRMLYQHFIGAIPDTLTLDHLCRNRWCVNPVHLEIVTRGENVLRGVSISTHFKNRTHCNYGHEFTPQNTYWHKQRNGKSCRECATCVKDRTLSRYYKHHVTAKSAVFATNFESSSMYAKK